MKYRAVTTIEYRAPLKPGWTLRDIEENPPTKIPYGTIFDPDDENIDQQTIANLLRHGAIKSVEVDPL